MDDAVRPGPRRCRVSSVGDFPCSLPIGLGSLSDDVSPRKINGKSDGNHDYSVYFPQESRALFEGSINIPGRRDCR